MSTPDVSIIIVNWNSGDLLSKCLDSIRNSDSTICIETIVVDNASEDGSMQTIHLNYPEVIVISNEQNHGFSFGCNQGLKRAKGTFVLLLNPDTALSPETLRIMVDFMREHPKAGAAGCMIVNEDGSLQSPCRRRYPTPFISFLYFTRSLLLLEYLQKSVQFFMRKKLLISSFLSRVLPSGMSHLSQFILDHEYEMRLPKQPGVHTLEAVSGAFILIRNDLFTELGGMDETFFLFGEDLDICYRITSYNNGYYSIYFVPEAKIVHLRGKCREHAPVLSIRESHRAMLLFHKKHFASRYPWLVNALVFLGIYAHYSISRVSHLFKPNSKTAHTS